MLNLVTPPTTEPVTVEQAVEHVRLDSDDELMLIAGYIQAARDYVETRTRRALMAQTWDLVLDAWPGRCLYLPKPPLQSVTSITYVDADGVTGTVDADSYSVAAGSPGMVLLVGSHTWPSVTLRQAAAVTVRFVAGYASREMVPAALRQAMLLLVAEMYETRQITIVGTSVSQATMTADRLVDPLRFRYPKP